MVIDTPNSVFAEIHIQGLSEWMWRGFSRAQKSVKIELSDGRQLEFRMYGDQGGTTVPPGQEPVNRASVIITSLDLEWGEIGEFRRIAVKLARFLSFVTDTHLQTMRIEVYAYDDSGSKISTEPKEILFSERLADGEEPDFSYLIPVPRYREVQDQLADLVKRWFQMYDEWLYAIQLYFIACVEDPIGFLDPNLVLSVMALEALHQAQALDGDGPSERLQALTQPFADHFGPEEVRDRAAEQLRTLRNQCVHGGTEIPNREFLRDLRTSLCFAESLIKLHMLRRLGLDIDKSMRDGTDLKHKMGRARRPPFGEELAREVDQEMAKARKRREKKARKARSASPEQT